MKKQIVMSIILSGALMYGCATPSEKLPAQAPPYVYGGAYEHKPTEGSLWNDGAGLYEDSRARRLNDLVTIKIVETVKGSNKQDTTTNKETKNNDALSNFFDVTLAAAKLSKGLAKVPQIRSNNKDSFKGTGATSNEGTLIGTITARVVDVQPNGNMVIDSRKEITVNYEKQILVLQGIIRADDVDPDNTVTSQRVAEARLFLVGAGFMSEQQSAGTFNRFMSEVMPF
jgi:flagellar L-ring protein precursor FlgH